jgi:hypothetical protein
VYRQVTPGASLQHIKGTVSRNLQHIKGTVSRDCLLYDRGLYGLSALFFNLGEKAGTLGNFMPQGMMSSHTPHYTVQLGEGEVN